MISSLKQMVEGFVVARPRLRQGVVDVSTGEPEVSQLNKGPQMLASFFLFHLFQVQHMLDLNSKNKD